MPKGYYGLESLFLMVAFLALARLPSLEQLRYCAPGEWGKLLGLDRIPEVRTVRKKLALLSDQEQVNAWSAELCAQWMGEDPEQASVLYVDGHVRVYHGDQTQLPRHYVARQKLCLRATTDYWVRHEVARIFIREICAKTDQLIGCSATRTLPGRALGATLGCEASGTL